MKKFVALLLCLTCVAALVACTSGGNDKTDNTDKEIEEALDTLKNLIDNASDNNNSGDDSSVDWGNLWDTGSNDNAVAEPVDPKTVDYSKIDLELPDDGSMMQEFMNDVQAGKYDNKVVKVKGIMSTGTMDPTTNSVMQKIGNDGVKLGVSWRIVDANDSTTYPADDSQIELVGVVLSEYVEAWGMYGHYIYVLPENVKDLGYPEN